MAALEARVWPEHGEGAPAPRRPDDGGDDPSLARVLGGLIAAGSGDRPARAAGERALMCAVLADAVACLSGWRQHPAPAAEARRWVLSPDREWPFSFENLCDALGISTSRLRRCLLRDVPPLDVGCAVRPFRSRRVRRPAIRIVSSAPNVPPAPAVVPDDVDVAAQAPCLVDDVTSPRERDIVALVATGLRNVDVAARLSISVPTVKKHLNNVFQKLGIGSREELTGYAQRIGLV